MKFLLIIITTSLLLLAKELLCKQPLKSSFLDRKFPFDWKDVFLKRDISSSGADTDIVVTKSTIIKDLQFSDRLSVPKKGIVDYIGKDILDPSRFQNPIILEQDYLHLYNPPTKTQLLQTRFNLWRQLPWKKIRGKVILKIKLGGSLPLEAPPGSALSFLQPKDYEPINSLSELTTLFNYAAHDPRVTGVFINVGRLSCGYAKLQELRRVMTLFRQSGKQIIAFAEAVSEKELYFSLFCDQFFVPPDGIIDIRGFSAGASFVRGVLDKVGIEPQVQRIGKYKSAGDSINRTEIADAQREVISSLLSEASGHWIRTVAAEKNKSYSEVERLWSEAGVRTPADFRDRGYISGVRYLDQAEDFTQDTCVQEVPDREPGVLFSVARSISKSVGDFCRATRGGNDTTSVSQTQNDFAVRSPQDADKVDFNLETEFLLQPRRSLIANADSIDSDSLSNSNSNNNNNNKQNFSRSAEKTVRNKRRKVANFLVGGLYLRKMSRGSNILKGLQLQETTRGPRIAIINAVGGISSGASSSNGLGSDTLVKLLQEAERNPSITGVVLRVDSPGGSALASDVIWRAIRKVSREKPVVASMVDVAASGGYYLSMACDQILAEDLTITGSIGVVTAKFNAEKLIEKIGFKEETLSIGRYAELLTTSRGFTADEQQQFESFGQQAYRSFVTKAAASRGMDYEAMQEVAQGRVWTGRQAMERGLVDSSGGLFAALDLVTRLANKDNQNFNYDLTSLSSNLTESLTKMKDLAQKTFGCQIRVRAIDRTRDVLLLRCTGPAANRRSFRKILDKNRSVKIEGDEVFRIQTLQAPRQGGLGLGVGSSAGSVLPVEKVLALCDDQAACDIGLVSRETMGLGLGLGLGPNDWATVLSGVAQGGDSSQWKTIAAAAWRAIREAILE